MAELPKDAPLVCSAFFVGPKGYQAKAVRFMQPRGLLRKMVSLLAEYISGGVRRPVFIGNVSEEGMHMVTLNKETEAQFFPGKNVELKVRLSSMESVPVRCTVKWVSVKKPPYGATYDVGLEVIEPPSQYLSFVKSLYEPYCPL